MFQSDIANTNDRQWTKCRDRVRDLEPDEFGIDSKIQKRLFRNDKNLECVVKPVTRILNRANEKDWTPSFITKLILDSSTSVYDVLTGTVNTTETTAKTTKKRRRSVVLREYAHEGDTVKVIDDESRVASLNSFLVNGRGGWKGAEMKQYLGTRGKVMEVVQVEKHRRLLRLKFQDGKEYDFNSKSVLLLSKDEEEEDQDFVIEGMDQSKEKAQQEEEDQTQIIGAEDFFPIFVASLAMSNVREVWKVLKFAELFCVDRDASKDAGQVEYYLTSFEAAVRWIMERGRVRDDEKEDEEEEQQQRAVSPSHCRTAPYRDGTRKLVEANVSAAEVAYSSELV